VCPLADEESDHAVNANGGEVIKPFALVMSFGIAVGTFSAIFVAAPILLWIDRRWGGRAYRTDHMPQPNGSAAHPATQSQPFSG
jgi:Protein export membrane protein